MMDLPEAIAGWNNGYRALNCPKLGRTARFLELWQRLPVLEKLYSQAEKDATVTVCLGARLVREMWPAPYAAIACYGAMVFWAKRRRLLDKSRRKGAPKVVLALWNAMLAAFSAVGAVRTVPHLYVNWLEEGFKSTVCTPPVVATWGIGATGLWVQMFVYSKFIELGDTVFMVLSNKDVPFIHWFHHAATLYFCWYSYIYESSYALYFVCMNYTVHAIMYAYFVGRALNVVPSWFPASAITVVQIAQMFVGVAVQIVAAVYNFSPNTTCSGIHRGSLLVGTLMYGSYLYLFAEFLVRRLRRRPSAALSSRRATPEAATALQSVQDKDTGGGLNWCGGGDPMACCNVQGQNDAVAVSTVLTALMAVLVALVCRQMTVGAGLIAKRVATLGASWLLVSWLRQVYNRHILYAAWPSPPQTLPVLGNALSAAPAFMRYLLREAKRQSKCSGNFLFWPGGPSPIAVITTPKAAKEVLGQHSTYVKGPDYTTKFSTVFGKGLVTSMGPDHSRARRVMGKYFIKGAVEEHISAISEIADRLADSIIESGLSPEPTATAVFDVQEYFHMVTLNVFCKTQLNLDVELVGTSKCPIATPREFDVIKPPDAGGFFPPGTVAHWMADEVSFGSNVIGTHMIYNIPLSKMFPSVRRCMTSLSKFSVFILRLIEHRRELMRAQPDSCPDDCLTALLREQQENTEMPLPDEEICQQIITLISAGHDTTAYFCCYAALMLAKHPEMQSNLRAELLADTFDWPNSLLKRVMQEVLRLYPVIPMVTRVSAKAASLPTVNGDKLKLPKDTRILVPFFALNRLPSLWGADAAEFNPDRWLETNQSTPSEGIQFYKNGFMPFGYGSRTCIGYTFALVEARAILTRLLARFELIPVPGFSPTIKAGVSLTVENPKGIKISFRRVQK